MPLDVFSTHLWSVIHIASASASTKKHTRLLKIFHGVNCCGANQKSILQIKTSGQICVLLHEKLLISEIEKARQLLAYLTNKIALSGVERLETKFLTHIWLGNRDSCVSSGSPNTQCRPTNGVGGSRVRRSKTATVDN